MGIYDFFDDIVCINLDISTDRRDQSIHYLNKLNIPIKFFTAKKHIKGGIYGCFDSHIQILLDAKRRNLNNILVFEDDFIPTASYNEDKLQIAIEFMKNNEEWDIFHLAYLFIKDDKDGITSIFNGKTYGKDIIEFNPFCTLALCYNKKAIDRILEEYNEYIGIIHYDMYISSYLKLKNFCIIPMIFDQNWNIEYNIEPADAIEYVVRSAYPLIAYTKLNYNMSLLKYYINMLNIRYGKYNVLFIIATILFIIKKHITRRTQTISKCL